MNIFNPEVQLKDSNVAVRNNVLTELRGFKFVTTVVLQLKKYRAMMKLNVAPITHPQSLKQLLMSHIGKVFESIYSTIISNIHKPFGKRFC